MVIVDGIDNEDKVHKEGNIITSHSTDDFEREREFQEVGTVVALGPTAYNMSHHGDPWVKVGDTVLYKKYDGKQLKDDKTGKLYRIINDEDVIAKKPQ